MTAHYRRIMLRRGTAARWTEVNPLLAAGEPGLELDTGRVKYGDGVTNWSGLAYSDTAEGATPSDISLAYDVDGRLETVTKSSGGVVTLAYDGSGKLATVSDSGSGLTKTLVYSGQVLQEVQVTATP